MRAGGKKGHPRKDGKIGHRRRESGSKIHDESSAANRKLNQLNWESPPDLPVRSHKSYLKRVGQFAPRRHYQNDGRQFDLAFGRSQEGWNSALCSSLADLASNQRKDLKNDSFGSWYSRSTSDPWRNGRVRFCCTGH